MPLAISSRINVSSRVTDLPTAASRFGRVLLLTLDDRISDDDLVKTYSNINEVLEDFPAGGVETIAPQYNIGRVYEDALVYFSQPSINPQPLIVGKLVGERAGTILLATEDAGDNGTIAGLSSPVLTVNGVNVPVTFASDDDYEDIASKTQTAMRAATGSTATAAGLGSNNEPEVGIVTVDSAVRFYIKLGMNADGNPYPTVFTGNIATQIQLLSSDNPESYAVLDEDFATSAALGDAIEKIKDKNNDWLWVAMDSDLEQASGYTTRLSALVTWLSAQTDDRKIGLISVPDEKSTTYPDGRILEASETATLGAILHAIASDRFVMLVRNEVSGSVSPNTALGIGARFSAVDFEGSGILPTANGFNLGSNVRPLTVLNSAGKDELDRKNVNVFTTIGGRNVLLEGVASSGKFIDQVVWVAWAEWAIAREVFNLLASSDRVPLSDTGLALVRASIERICDQGVRNAGITPGVLDTPTRAQVVQVTGNTGFDGSLPLGYFVYNRPLSTLSDADRAIRKSPDFHVWFKGSGAIHYADIHLVFNPA